MIDNSILDNKLEKVKAVGGFFYTKVWVIGFWINCPQDAIFLPGDRCHPYVFYSKQLGLSLKHHLFSF